MTAPHPPHRPSGHQPPAQIWDGGYYQGLADELPAAATFRPAVFAPRAAIAWQSPHGRLLSAAQPDAPAPDANVVPDGWDHEHCEICNFTILRGMHAWRTSDLNSWLCDACYDQYRAGPPPQET